MDRQFAVSPTRIQRPSTSRHSTTSTNDDPRKELGDTSPRHGASWGSGTALEREQSTTVHATMRKSRPSVHYTFVSARDWRRLPAAAPSTIALKMAPKIANQYQSIMALCRRPTHHPVRSLNGSAEQLFPAFLQHEEESLRESSTHLSIRHHLIGRAQPPSRSSFLSLRREGRATEGGRCDE